VFTDKEHVYFDWCF